MNILHPLIELQTVDSTNLCAARLLKKENVAEGTILLAHEQTSGMGQGGNRWESEPGKNATFSLVLFPGFLQPARQFFLNKAIALALTDFLSGFRLERNCSVKWPNDIYVADSKIGGILIQNTVCGTVYESCIAGIGVNINQETFSHGLPNPVSLKHLTGKNIPVKEAVVGIVSCIDERYRQLREGWYEPLDREYRERLLGISEWRDFLVNKMLIKGKIRGVDESGRLKMELGNGSFRLFNHGEIEFMFR